MTAFIPYEWQLPKSGREKKTMCIYIFSTLKALYGHTVAGMIVGLRIVIKKMIGHTFKNGCKIGLLLSTDLCSCPSLWLCRTALT